MFFLGILIGVGVYALAMLIWHYFESIGWSLLGTIILAIALYDYSSSMTWGMVVAIVVLFIIGYNMGKKEEEKNQAMLKSFNQMQQNINYYKSHCWHCGNPIDGAWNKKCPDCKEYYICPKCGACKCDFGKDPPYKH